MRPAASGVVMTARPTTMRTRLARRLGIDGNPLRRRSDVIAAWLLPVAIVLFLGLCPVIWTATGMRVRADNAAVQRAEPTWHRVDAQLLQAAGGPQPSGSAANSWTVLAPVRWVEDGHARDADYPVPAATPAGSQVKIWLNRAGNLEIPPMTAAQIDDRVLADTFVALAVFAVLLGGLTWGIRRVLDRRRLAGWEAEWMAVGPRWSRQG
jgi:hypothetical protein